MLTSLGLTVLARQYAVDLDGASTYTADMLVRGRDGMDCLVEVKGTYRLGSHHAGLRGFNWARQRTGIGGLWVERRKASRGKAAHWRIEVYA
jgi:hypothetical protein